MKPTNEIAADLLAIWRKHRGWTQVRAARWYGVTERTWRRWERREVNVPPSVLKRIAGKKALRAAGVPLEGR